MTVLARWAAVADASRMLRATVAELTGYDPGPLFHSCPHCGSIEHGRPYVAAPVSVSVAHASGLSVVAVSAAGAVGVDLEAGHDLEWTRREAIAKAHGTGIVEKHPTSGAWVEELLLPSGYVGAVAGLSDWRPEVRGAPWHSATGRTEDAVSAP